MTRVRVVAVCVLAFALAAAAGAWSYWSAQGTGVASAEAASLTPGAISVPATATNSVTVMWDQQASLLPSAPAGSDITYIVQRRFGSGAYETLESSGCAGAKPLDTASCTDSPPSDGNYSYRAIASIGSWTATSATTSSITVSGGSPPVVNSITRLDPNPSSADTVRWTVTFSEAVTGVDGAVFALARTGTVSASAVVQSVSGSATTYTVSATTGSGEGTLGLNIAANGTVLDGAGNALDGDFSGPTYTIDRATPPSPTALQMLDTDANGKIDQVTVTFDETLVSSTATAPWTLTSVPSGGTLVSVSTSGTIATLTLDEGAGAADTALGSFTVALAANAAGIRDATGHEASFAAASPTDLAAPARTAMSMLDVDTDGKIDSVTMSFSEAVASPITATAFVLTNTPSGGTLVTATQSSNVVTLTIAEGTGPAATAVGTFTLALTADPTGVRDSAGNEASFAAAAPADKARPVPISVSDTSGLIDGRLELLDSFAATFSEAIATASLPTLTVITEDGEAPATDHLTIDGFTSGPLALTSANYVFGTSMVVFAGTSVLSGGGTKITSTAALCTSGCLQVRTGSGTGMIFIPATTLLDAAGNAATGSHTTGFRIF